MSSLFDNPDSSGMMAGQALSSGLQGLVDAYKIKLSAAQEQAKIRQQGFDSGAMARMMAPYRASMIDARNAGVVEKAREFDLGGGAATAAPITSPDGKFIQEKGKWVPVPQPTRGLTAKAKTDTALGMLDALSEKWDGLKTGSSTGSATMNGALLKMQSMAPSSDAGQYDAAAQAFAGKLDHDLLGRVNDVTIANAKKAIPGFYDTPESKKNKMDYIRGIYSQAPSTPASPAPAGPMSTLRAALPSAAVPTAPTGPQAMTPTAPDQASISPVEAELRRRGALQ